MIQIDRRTVIQILGSLMRRPSILNDVDKYQIVPTDFSQQLDRYIFSAIYNLYAGGAEMIHAIDVETYLQTNESAKTLIKKENGVSFLQDCENYAEPENFNYYYNRFKKIVLLRELSKTGKDISNFYCEDPLNPNAFKINDNFEKLTPTDIVNTLKGEIAILEDKYSTNSLVEESKAFDGVSELLEELKVKPEVGVKLQGDIFNTICRGGRKGKLYLRSMGSGVGKALPNYTRIPTPCGWTTVEKVKVGDYLFDRFGKPTKVLAIYPQKEKKQIYKVCFKSGRVAECCDEHLWSYYENDNSNKLLTSTLKELINRLQNKNRLSVPICNAVEYSEKAFSIDPYVIGLILSNKNFRHKDINVEDILKNYPDLLNKKDKDKFIPEEYLFGSIKQRFDLLAGLLDANGSIDANGQVNYITKSSLLKNNIIELCESLGIIFNITQNNKEDTIYNINIKTSKENKIKMFKLAKNKSIAESSFNDEEKMDRDPIVKIEATDRFEDMTCFYVDNEEHLFLMNNFICTHNTRTMVGDACNIAYPIRYEPMYGRWIATGSAEPVLYVMTEQDPAEIQTMILAYLTGLNEEVFLYGTFEEKDMDRITTALSIMERYKDNMLFARIPDPCASVVKNLFRRYSFQKGVENFFYDYIFSSPAMLEEYRDLKLREDVCLRLFTTALKNLAVELNAFILTSTQISNDDGDGFRDFRNIQGSKSIANLVDLACITSRPSQNEEKDVSGFQGHFNFTPNIVTDIFKNRRGRWTMVRIWSRMDLGTCRKYDLFVTTPTNHPIEDFQIVDFTLDNYNERKELEEFYNHGVVSDDYAEELISKIPDIMPESPTDKITQAFGDFNEQKKRVKNMNFGDLLE